MSSLANQQQNLSFPGLLQVPGGITNTLQQVQDGNGNVTGLSLSSAGASVTTSSTFQASKNGTTLTGATARLISDGFGDLPTVKDFGAVGNGSTDDTAAFTAAIAATPLGVAIPAGSYKITGTVTGNFYSFGVVTIVTGTVTTIINLTLPAPAPTFIASINGTSITNAISRLSSDGFGDQPTAKDFGATGNGTTNDSATFVLADAALSGIIVPAGTYLISTSLTFTKAVILMPGASFIIPTGVIVTFNGGFSAPIQLAFNCSGTGAVVFNARRLSDGHPEWWGAQTNDISFNCLPALTACYTAVTKTILQNAQYYIFSTWQLSLSNKIVEGVIQGNIFTPSTTSGTQIISTSPTANVILVGLSADPGAIGSFAQNITLYRIGTGRSVAVTPPAAGYESTAATGVRTQYVLNVLFEDVYVLNNSIGFSFAQCVFSHFVRCMSGRTVTGNTAVNDIYWGFYLNGAAPYNLESLYFTDCSSVANPVASGTTIGFAADGTFTDTFLLRPEVDAHQYGMLLQGSGASKPSLDNQIIGGIFDQNTIYGISILNQPIRSSFKLVDNYCVMNAAVTAVAAYAIINCLGSVTLIANEAGGYGGATAVGLFVNGSYNVMSQGNNWSELTRPVALVSSTSCYISDNIYNSTQIASQAAIYINASSSRNVIDSIINSAASKFPYGVTIDSTSSYNEVRCSGINPFGISSGSANKLVYNATQVTTATTFGTGNLSSGIMG